MCTTGRGVEGGAPSGEPGSTPDTHERLLRSNPHYDRSPDGEPYLGQPHRHRRGGDSEVIDRD